GGGGGTCANCNCQCCLISDCPVCQYRMDRVFIFPDGITGFADGACRCSDFNTPLQTVDRLGHTGPCTYSETRGNVTITMTHQGNAWLLTLANGQCTVTYTRPDQSNDGTNFCQGGGTFTLSAGGGNCGSAPAAITIRTCCNCGHCNWVGPGEFTPVHP